MKTLREQLPRAFPGATFSFLPADIVSQILNFGSPAPIDVQIAGNDLAASRAFANKLLAKIRHVPGVADPRIQEAFQDPGLKVDFNRELAGVVGLTENDASTSIQATPVGQHADRADLLAQPGQRRLLPGLRPDAAIRHRYARRPQEPAADRPRNRRSCSAASPPFRPSRSTRSSRITTSATPSNIYATTQGRDLGSVAADIQKIVDDMRGELPKGATVTIRGQVATMASAYQQLLIGLGFSIVLIYLLIVVNFQSWLDPFVIIMALPAALAGIVWMLFVTHTTLSVPALDRRDHVHGRGDRQQHSGRQLRARAARGRQETPSTPRWRPGATRFRPVLMTALAMIIGMAPMAIEPGQNAPLGRAVIGGLLFATFATLLFVPTAVLHRRTDASQAKAACGRSRSPACPLTPDPEPLMSSDTPHRTARSRAAS